MKTIKTWLATIALLLYSMVTSAQTKIEIDGIWYNLVSEIKQAEVTYKGNSFFEYDDEYANSITIPTTVTYEGNIYNVTSIGNNAFSRCRSLTAITIPESVTTIGNGAFDDCSNLTDINISEGTTCIENNAFYNCSSLITINIPESVVSIGSSAFGHCINLTSINLPKGMTSIEGYIFNGCSSLISINIPEGVTSIGEAAFAKCINLSQVDFSEESELTKIGDRAFQGELRGEELEDGMFIQYYCSSLTSITIPQSVTSIGNNAFDGCCNLIEVIIPRNSRLENIGEGAFANCEKLSSIIIPESVKSIGNYAFNACKSLTDITIPGSVTNMGDEPFNGCSGLKHIVLNCSSVKSWFYYNGSIEMITLGEGVKSIESSAFAGCSGLLSVILPRSIEEIGTRSFANCYELTNVYCYSETVPSIPTDVFDGSYIEYATLHVPESSLEAYKSADVWKDFGNIVAIANPSSTIDSGTYTSGETELTWEFTSEGELKIEGVGSIPNITNSPWMKYQNDIEKASLGEGITEIGINSFYNCSNLTAITIPNSVTSIGGGAFDGCSSLTAITIPESVTSIGGQAFNECNSLTSIIIPESVTSIGNQIFTGCKKLTSIIFNASVSSVDLHEVLAFGAPNVKSLYIGRHVAGIKIPNAMESCNWSCLEQLVVDEDNPTYDSRDNCNAIIETATNKLIVGCGVTIVPNSVSFIGPRAFAFLGNLTNMVIPDHVVVIDNAAFYGCTNLAEVYISSLASHIVHQAFGNCQGLKSITCGAINPPIVAHPSGAPEQYGAFYGVSKSECVLYVPEESIEAYKAADTWKEFTNIQAMMRSIELSDDTESFAQSKVTECASLTYTRTFNNTNWQALYVPFEIPVTEEFLADFEVADLNDIRQYDRDEDGVKDETVVEAFKVKSGVLEANYPYLIRAREAGEKTITVTDATLYATEENSIDCSSVREKFTFTGTYSQLSSEELPQGEGYYALSGGVWQPVAEGALLGAFRFYLKVDSRNSLNATQGNAIRMRIIGEDGEEDDATRIDTSEFNDLNSELIFDLQGRRVENPTKGVYIVNGVKRVF